jgi:hypothetical protein
VFINHPDERYMKQFAPHAPGTQLLFTLKAINDFPEPESGDVKVKLLDAEGKVVWSQDQNININPYGEKNYPVVLDLPEKTGGYLLVTEFSGKLSPVKSQISRRYIKVGEGDLRYYSIQP